jgi:hypothetical protein
LGFAKRAAQRMMAAAAKYVASDVCGEKEAQAIFPRDANLDHTQWRRGSWSWRHIRRLASNMTKPG